MPTPPKPISGSPSTTRGSIARSPFSSSFIASSPLAQESLQRDIEEGSEDETRIIESDDEGSSSDDESEASTVRPVGQNHSMANSYRRPSFVAYGGPRASVTPHVDVSYATKKEKKQARSEQRSLLRDNHLAPEKERSFAGRIYRKLFSTKRPVTEDDEEVGQAPLFTAEPSETSALLANGMPESARDGHERRNRAWEQAVKSGKIRTTWQRETKTLVKYSSPLVITFVLQYSLTVASIFTVGHLGKIELGAVSLASMTANITGYAVFQGLATSLDTLCAQAYGSGRKHLVGLQLQRMVWFLWALTIPIGLIWFFAEHILNLLVPDPRSAKFAGLYLRVLVAGAPGYCLFEAG